MNKTIYGKEARDLLREGVDYLANAVKVTLGPRGKNVVLFDDNGNPYLTKDGVSVAKKVTSDNPLHMIGINMVREAAINTANEVGDATTTSTILAQAILNNGLKAIDDGYNPTFVKVGMDDAVEEIISLIDDESEKIDSDEKLLQVATISANNNEAIGEIAVKAIKKAGEYGIIKLKESPTYDTYIEVNEGFQIKRGYASSYFITDRQTNEAKYKNVLLCLADRDIDSESDIVPILKKAINEKSPIVIIANDFSNRVMDIMINNHFHHKVEVLAIKTPGFGEGRSAVLEDISKLTNIEVWKNKELFAPAFHVGYIEEIVSNIETTTIIGKSKSEDFNDYIDKLKCVLSNTNDENLYKRLEERLAMLTSGITNVYVGATTELEMREKKDRVEDAICATKVALEEGIVAGGGSVFARIYKNVNYYDINPEENAGFYAVINALNAPYIQLGLNANYTPEGEVSSDLGFDFKDLRWCDLKEKGIIDPSKALKTAIKNAVSIASMIISTECIVLD
jgi:chaperonin GroEL